MKKEHYRLNLPHFQQPGQTYFVTWNLKDVVPKKALVHYSQKLEKIALQIKSLSKGLANSNSPFNDFQINPDKININNYRQKAFSPELDKIKKEFYSLRKKYIKAYDDLLDIEKNPSINLSKAENTKIIINTLQYWEGKKLKNHAFTIMPNHVHWILELFEKDDEGSPVFLQDVLQSVKRFSANQINRAQNRKGNLWQKESFETTIRDEKHLYYAVRYTVNNPVIAGLSINWRSWPGTRCESVYIDF